MPAERLGTSIAEHSAPVPAKATQCGLGTLLVHVDSV